MLVLKLTGVHRMNENFKNNNKKNGCIYVLLLNLNTNYLPALFKANVKHHHDWEAEILFLFLPTNEWEDHMQKFKLKCRLGLFLFSSTLWLKHVTEWIAFSLQQHRTYCYLTALWKFTIIQVKKVMLLFTIVKDFYYETLT